IGTAVSPARGHRGRWLLPVLACVACLACRDPKPSGEGGGATRERRTIVLSMQPLWGPPGPFAQLLEAFEARHPDVRVEVRTLPNDSDLARQAFLTALGGGDPLPDVFVLDVVW